MFQEGLLHGLAVAGLPANILFSLEPIPAFPHGGRLFGRSGKFVSGSGRAVRLLPFVNIHPLKWLTAGISVLVALVWWSWRYRGRPRLVHCVNISMPPGLFVWLAARLTGTRTLVSGHRRGHTRWARPRHSLSKDGFCSAPVAAPAVRRVDGRLARHRERFSARAPVCLIEGGVSPEFIRERARRIVQRRPSTAPFRSCSRAVSNRYNGVELALDVNGASTRRLRIGLCRQWPIASLTSWALRRGIDSRRLSWLSGV